MVPVHGPPSADQGQGADLGIGLHGSSSALGPFSFRGQLLLVTDHIFCHHAAAMENATSESLGHIQGTVDDDWWERARQAGACEARRTLDLIGDKWSVFVIALLGDRRRRFSELKREIGGISQRMLTVTLRQLDGTAWSNAPSSQWSPPGRLRVDRVGYHAGRHGPGASRLGHRAPRRDRTCQGALRHRPQHQSQGRRTQNVLTTHGRGDPR